MTGRPPKPSNLHALHGTARPDRHADRVDGVFPSGEPVQPESLSGISLDVWKFIAANYPPSVLSRLDTYALWAACDWWTVYRTLMDTIRDSEMPSYKLQIQAGHAWNMFDRIVARFGLTPVDRARIKSASASEDDDPLLLLLKERSASN